MNIFEFFTNKKTNEIGTFECTSSDLKTRLLSLAGYVGMRNPVNIVNATSRGVSIRKNDDTYIITLHAFNPPLEVTWSDPIDDPSFIEYVDSLIALNNSIAYINVRHSGTSGVHYQFGVC